MDTYFLSSAQRARKPLSRCISSSKSPCLKAVSFWTTLLIIASQVRLLFYPKVEMQGFCLRALSIKLIIIPRFSALASYYLLWLIAYEMLLSLSQFFFSFVLISATNAQCYYPGGDKIAYDHQPCLAYVETSLCCPTGWTCFSNMLFVATDPSVITSTIPLGTSIRGTCQNPNWNESACGSFCLSELTLFILILSNES